MADDKPPKHRFWYGTAGVLLDGYEEVTTVDSGWSLYRSVVDGAEFLLGETAGGDYWLLYPVLSRTGRSATIDEKRPIPIRKGA